MNSTEQDDLARQWLPYAYAIAHQWTKRHGRDLADDFRSAALMGLTKAIQTYRPVHPSGASFKTFLVSVIRNQCHHVREAFFGRSQRNIKDRAEFRAARKVGTEGVTDYRSKEPQFSSFQDLLADLGVNRNDWPMFIARFWEAKSWTDFAGSFNGGKNAERRLSVRLKLLREIHQQKSGGENHG